MKNFQCFDNEIYLAILLSILILSCVTAINTKKIKTSLWIYISIILSDNYSIRMNSKSVNRILFGVWLLVCTVLLAAFSGILRDRLMKTDMAAHQIYIHPCSI